MAEKPKNRRLLCIGIPCLAFLVAIGIALLITWYAILPADDPDYNLHEISSSTTEVFISSQQLEELLNSETGATVLDARPRYHSVVERTKPGYGDSIDGARGSPWTDFTINGGRDELKSVAEIERLFQERGVSNDVPVVVFGSWKEGWGEEGRIYWQLDWLNHTKAFILYGGIFGWNGTGRGVDGMGDFVARPVEERYSSAEQINSTLSNEEEVLLLDARAETEYLGSTPHGSSRGGHIPTAESFDWRRVFDSDQSGNLKSPEVLQAELTELGLKRNQSIIVYCTSGVRAGFLYSVLRWIGLESISNYPGSWYMWSQDLTLPVQT